MNTASRYLVLLAVFLLFSSCAVHEHFPFICFRGECIKDQWTFGKINKPDFKAFKKQVKVRARTAKRKRKIHKSNLIAEFPQLTLYDTSKIHTGNPVIYTRFVLFFKRTGQRSYSDTTIISYSSEFRNIVVNDKEILIYLMQRINPNLIEVVIVREIINELTDKNEGHHQVRKRENTVRRFLKKEGVTKSKIIFVPRPD